MTEPDESDEAPESGPFCRHWSELGCCEELCATCGHRCGQHDEGDECFATNDDGSPCDCIAWVNEGAPES